MTTPQPDLLSAAEHEAAFAAGRRFLTLEATPEEALPQETFAARLLKHLKASKANVRLRFGVINEGNFKGGEFVEKNYREDLDEWQDHFPPYVDVISVVRALNYALTGEPAWEASPDPETIKASAHLKLLYLEKVKGFNDASKPMVRHRYLQLAESADGPEPSFLHYWASVTFRLADGAVQLEAGKALEEELERQKSVHKTLERRNLPVETYVERYGKECLEILRKRQTMTVKAFGEVLDVSSERAESILEQLVHNGWADKMEVEGREEGEIRIMYSLNEAGLAYLETQKGLSTETPAAADDVSPLERTGGGDGQKGPPGPTALLL